MKIIVQCIICRKKFLFRNSPSDGIRKYCTLKCFKEGFKGHIVSSETRRKISFANKGRKHTEETRKKLSKNNYWRGKKIPLEIKAKREKYWKTHSQWNKGKKTSEEIKRKISESQKGAKHYRWIEDRTKLSRISKQGERRTSAYLFWRKSVWGRDNWRCKINNGNCKGRLEAHHILSWREYPQLRYELNNGITLCHVHHPQKWAEEKQLVSTFQKLVPVSASKEYFVRHTKHNLS